jgi:hypothetical protein
VKLIPPARTDCLTDDELRRIVDFALRVLGILAAEHPRGIRPE